MTNSSQKCVAIIGAGVSGLISAVNMYKVGIQPIVFEQASNIGGIWNIDIKPCWNSMTTNISKFSTTLSDFSWSKNMSIFPNQRDVYQYLSNYVQQSLPNNIFRFNTQVLNITYFNHKWTVEYSTKLNNKLSEQYDFVIVASGFCNCSYIPKNIIDHSSFQGTLIHSSNYHSPEQVYNKRVIIVGASMSAVQIAADMATTAKHIIHIVPHSFWSLPRFIPLIPNDPVSPLLPIDFVLFRQSKRISKEEILFRNKDDYKKLNQYYRLITGNNQKSFYLIDNDDDEKPPYMTISDMYAEWNRAAPLINERPDWILSLILNNGTTIETSSNDILILCTGYQPCFDFFSKDILEQLSYIPHDTFCPIILYRCTFHPSLPNLAFIGMQRGPLWPIIELQSRWVAGIFSGLLSTPSITQQQIGLNMERRIRDQQPRPQYPHGDFVGIINDLAKEILVTTSSDTNDIVIPTQYRINGPDQSVIDEMNSICEEANNGRFIAGAVFRSLHESKWTFERTLKGKPSDGIVHGQAQFNFSQQNELIYKEQGKLILSSQEILDITQKYIYIYDENKDLITVYFVDNNDKCSSIFHTISFQSKQSSNIGWIAYGEHLCNQDHYFISYLFIFNGINLSQFEITYTVKGPAKDYISKTIFQPIKIE
ncbi:unnamed protein product [Rotaria sordida]|uniref:Flavin-containing monooxygenase n=1 Tax=Rotaria sordida TaxID=392033 RepID=A0A819WCP2_9BILA|nr:unnamed protein product [Rotaria sordida]